MKKLKFILLPLLLLGIVVACEKDGGESVIDLSIGATPNIQKISSTDQSINLIGLNNGDDIDLGFTVEIARGDVASVDVVGFYFSTTGVEKTVFQTDITTFPTTLHVTQNDLYTAFPAISSASDISITDALVISAELTLKDGRIIKMYTDEGVKNFGADISNSQEYSVSQTYTISCPLSDASNFDGNYSVVQDTWEDYGVGEIVPVEYDSALGLLKFKVLSVNNPYIDNPDTSYMIVTIDPTNSSVSVVSNENFAYTGWLSLPVTGTGSVGSCTGDISLVINYGPYGPYYLDLTKAGN